MAQNTDVFDKIISRHKEEYQKYGYDEKSLCWSKQRQNIRFCALTEGFDLQGASILDIGCGFGDFNKYLAQIGVTEYDYLGIDINEDFIAEAKNIYKGREFVCANFLDYTLPKNFDYIITSGIFNYFDVSKNDYEYAKNVMAKAYANCNKAIAFDFLSDKTDYKDDCSCYNSPEKILSIAYTHTKNLVLKNNFLPFEFSVILYKDNTFSKQTYFNTLEHTHESYFKRGIFVKN